MRSKSSASQNAREVQEQKTLLRQDAAVALALFLVAFTLYALTRAPTITGEDAGELAAAAATLGVPHPPGYPLYVLTGKLVLTLIPFGEPAWRLNLFSGFLMALAAGLLYLLCRRMHAERVPSVCAALLASFSGTLWSQATITEVYALAAFVFLLLLHATLSFVKNPTVAHLVLVSYLFGLALTAHVSLVLFGPALVLFLLLRKPKLVLRPVALFSGAAFFLLGLSLYLYLPLRSLADPAMDWGDPESLGGFISHLLRRQYAGLGEAPAHPIMDRLAYLLRIAFVDVGPLITLPVLLGLRELRQTAPGRCGGFTAGSLAAVIAFSAGLLFVLSVSFSKQTLSLNRVFFIPLVLLLSVPCAFGLRRLAALLRPRLGPRPASALGPLCVVVLCLWEFPGQDRSSSFLAREYAEAVLRTLPPGSVFIPTGDYATFPVLYLQLVEGRRPDVVVADKYGYLDPSVLARLGASRGELASLPRAAAERWLIDRAGRPVFVNAKKAILELPTERFLPVGILYRVDRARRPLARSEEEKLWNSYCFSQLDRLFRWKGGRRDCAEDCIVADILTHRAESLFAWGEKEEALRVLEQIKEVGAPYREILQNTGSLLAEKGLFEKAFQFYSAALRLDPTYALCRRNYARALLRWGKEPGRAVEVGEESLRELPPDPEFLVLVGKAYKKLGRYGAAREMYLLASRLDVRDPEPLRLAGDASEKLGDKKAAKAFYGESLRRLPTQPALIEKVYGKASRRKYEARVKEVLKAMEAGDLHELPKQSLPAGEASGKQPRGGLSLREAGNG